MKRIALFILALGTVAASAASTNFKNIRGKDYYQFLGVAKSASEADIKSAYKNLMMQNHPDRGGSVERAQELNEAKDALLQTRAQYDRWLGTGYQSERRRTESDERPEERAQRERQAHSRRSDAEIRHTILHQIIGSAIAQLLEMLAQNPRANDYDLANQVTTNLLYMQRELPGANLTVTDLWRIFYAYTINPQINNPGVSPSQADTVMTALAGAVFKILKNQTDPDARAYLQRADELILRELKYGDRNYPLRSRLNRMYALRNGDPFDTPPPPPRPQRQSDRCAQAAGGHGSYTQRAKARDKYGNLHDIEIEVGFGPVKFNR